MNSKQTQSNQTDTNKQIVQYLKNPTHTNIHKRSFSSFSTSSSPNILKCKKNVCFEINGKFFKPGELDEEEVREKLSAIEKEEKIVNDLKKSFKEFKNKRRNELKKSISFGNDNNSINISTDKKRSRHMRRTHSRTNSSIDFSHFYESEGNKELLEQNEKEIRRREIQSGIENDFLSLNIPFVNKNDNNQLDLIPNCKSNENNGEIRFYPQSPTSFS